MRRLENENLSLDTIRRICDADPAQADYDGPGDLSTGSNHCPEFALHEKSGAVLFIDKAHNVVKFAIEEFNEFVRKVKDGTIRRADPLLRGEESHDIGTVRFSRDNEKNRIVVSGGADGTAASMAVKHFNVFVDAVHSGAMKELSVRAKSRSF